MLLIVSLETQYGVTDVVRRGLGEGPDTHVSVARLERRRRDTRHLDLGPAQRELEQCGAPLAADAEGDGAAGGAAHARGGAGEIAADVLAVDLHDLVPGLEPRALRGGALDGV